MESAIPTADRVSAQRDGWKARGRIETMNTEAQVLFWNNAGKSCNTVAAPLDPFTKENARWALPLARPLWAGVASVAVLLGLTVASFAQDQRPNILLIVADDMGYADMGAYGGEIETPNLDALAASGVRFTQFTAGAVCSPSRSMMLTGTDNHVAGLGNMAEMMAPNQVGQPGYEGELNDRVAPISALLRMHGYNTFMAGKWHMGEEPDKIPAAQGFIRDLALLPGGGSHLEDMRGLAGERLPFTLNGEPLTALRPGFDSSVDYTDAIISNLEEFRDDDQPFFAYLAYQAPHDPFQPPFNWRDFYKGRYDQGYDVTRADRIARMEEMGIIPENSTVFPRLPAVPAWEDLSDEERRASARSMELYAGMVSHMDNQIGKLTDYLKSVGEYDNTLVIFLSDNGPEGNMWPVGAPWDNSRIEDWGRAGTFIQYGPAWAQVSAGPLRMFKGYMSEGGLRTPMIMAGPGVADPGRISDSVTHVTDIAATILDAAGVAYPETFDGRAIAPLEGRSILPVIEGASASVRAPTDWIGMEMFGNRAVRMGDWKLLWLCEPSGTGTWQLYDLKTDPAEMQDLALVQPEIRDQMAGHWDEYAKANGLILPDRSPVCAAPG
jgi:arylsulfatase